MLQPTVSQPVCLGLTTRFLLLLDSSGFVDVGGLSLMRGQVCHLQLLLALTRTVILGSKTCGTRDLILLSDLRLPLPLPPMTHRAMVEVLKPASTQDCQSQTKSQSYVTTVGHSASLSWNKALILVLRPGLYYCMTAAGLLMWDALCDNRIGLSFARATVSSNVVGCQYVQFTFNSICNI
jgi:hypothetical protein